ncbi:hypothetical protein Vadar_003166 [Vaccinium darrowii]|uniref:Uncharacterized protein n=1 Tax=Vaccinium darrowii TaxID=229202 RepID=A0ACB7Z8S0_9ERIC|nr:hypothetical protein Vadar_003166 [Vaccinium darrowii]
MFREKSSIEGVEASRISKLSPGKFLKRIGKKVAGALNFVTRVRKSTSPVLTSSSRKSNALKSSKDNFWAEDIFECMGECIEEFVDSSCS